MEYAPRPTYENELKALRNTEDIKVLVGVRRCGKSTLLRWLQGDLLDNGVGAGNVFYRRMDLFGMPTNPNAEWLVNEISAAIEKSDPEKTFYVLLDEIQDVDGWERVVRQLHTRPNTDVYITGSNAYVLSSDLATLIGGRYVEMKVQPLSFSEYLSFSSYYDVHFPNEDSAFAEYLRYGGMPALFHQKERDQDRMAQLLRTVYETIILNDVVERTKIGDVDLLSKLVRYVFTTSGSLFSANKIANTLTSYGRKTRIETVEAYLRALVDALILHACEQVGLSGKDILRPQRKFYPVDTGLRNLASGFVSGDIGFQIENVVCNELLRRGWSVSVGSLRVGEVDFVAERAQKQMYIQVTESLVDQGVYEREISPLRLIGDSWPKFILTADRLRCGVTEEGIAIINVIDWLLDK